MVWTTSYLQSAKKKARKIDPQARQRIRKFLEVRLASLDDPRSIGKRLVGQESEIWRYRVGDYRILGQIEDRELIILVIDMDHRSRVYQR